MTVPTRRFDILVIGGGGAGLMAAIHAHDQAPRLRIALVSKGLVAQSGCTRLVQGGYNVVLNPADSVELHFRDTIRGGAFLNDQELAWFMVNQAPRTVLELENRMGCFFDRTPEGTVHQKPFAGQSFDRTVHKGDLTGIEIMTRLKEQLLARPVMLFEETRAVELLLDEGGGRVAGALLLDQKSGEFLAALAPVVVLAAGGGARMYRVSAPSLEKTGDGMAMAWRAGVEMRDMEMFQFHPTGLLAGASRLSGMVLEEGLRGAGGHLLNAQGERFMARYDPQRMERSTRDIVARSSYLEIVEGRGGPNDGVFLDVRHLGAERLRREFPGMVKRCASVGLDLTTEPVEVSPTAHYHMGGCTIDLECRSSLEGLLVVGEDAGGVHGANRLGGNGVADSTVFGAHAGRVAASVAASLSEPLLSPARVARHVEAALAPLAGAEAGDGAGLNPSALRTELEELMWAHAGVVRDRPGLETALARLEELGERLPYLRVGGGRRWNLAWQQALDLGNLLDVAALLVQSALVRTESRGAHYRSDHPERDDHRWLVHVCLRGEETFTRPVEMTRLKPEAAGA